MARDYLWQKVRLIALKRDSFRCIRCGTEHKSYIKKGGFVWKEDNLVVDHIIPIALDGPKYDIDNLQTLCKYCNYKKNAIDQWMIALNKRNKKIFKTEDADNA